VTDCVRLFPAPAGSLIARLARDRAGNTLAMIAAAIAPLMAMVGGGIDMGRAYVAQARLQQACDAGVLSARKRLGSEATVTGEIPESTGEIGQRFFNVNFRDGSYSSTERRFEMTLEEDYAISGAASVKVPTTIMRIFGFAEMPINVSCEAQINFNNTDVMMVLDVTGSMAQTNPGDSQSKIATLKQTVKGFYLQLQAAALAGTRIRYGFVPYSTNVNVGGLLQDDWVVNNWSYQSRQYGSDGQWQYAQYSYDVANWRTDSKGCMEERDTYQITDYDNVDLGRALDLDLDRIPVAGQPSTQWRPMYPGLIFARALEWNGSGSLTSNTVKTTKDFVSPVGLGTAACPAPAMKLTELDQDRLDAYLATLKAVGNTYHDIGMIWGGRLISPTGLFADENADVSASHPTNRNLIFLTDGETAPNDLSYSSYGLEPIDKRRWSPGSALTLTQHVERRFAFACDEVKKRNVTVWVIGFGTSLNPIMKDCAGPGHFFEAADAAELNATFAAIAKNMSRLRIER
jgi:hypothetical protein